MKAAIVNGAGDVPHVGEFEEPRPLDASEVLVQVRAASLKPLDRQLVSGSHYASARRYPAVCGMDGVGALEDGTRVYFAQPRWPFGAMAERTVVPKAMCWRLPDAVDDVTAAALVNPGMAGWLALSWRAKLVPGETVLILGATGVAGRLAVQMARRLGAGSVFAAGRDAAALRALRDLGADSTIQLDESKDRLRSVFADELRKQRVSVIVDFLWGEVTEALLTTLTGDDFSDGGGSEVRIVQAGSSAGPLISLPASALRGGPVTLLGAPGRMPDRSILSAAFDQLLASAAQGQLRMDTDLLPLEQVETAWGRESRGRRLVFAPPPTL